MGEGGGIHLFPFPPETPVRSGSPFWGSLTWHSRRSNERGLARVSKTLYYRGGCKHFFRRQLHRKQMVAVGYELQKQFSHGMRMEMGSEKLTCVPK